MSLPQRAQDLEVKPNTLHRILEGHPILEDLITIPHLLPIYLEPGVESSYLIYWLAWEPKAQTYRELEDQGMVSACPDWPCSPSKWPLYGLQMGLQTMLTN